MCYVVTCFHSSFFIILFHAGFSSRDELFSWRRDSSAVAGCYSAYISNQLLKFSELSHSTHIGALILEPGKWKKVVDYFFPSQIPVVWGHGAGKVVMPKPSLVSWLWPSSSQFSCWFFYLLGQNFKLLNHLLLNFSHSTNY